VEVVASTDVYGAIAAAVGGDAVHVTSIINSPDADPHEYQSTPADALAVGKAALVVYNGAGYDDFAPRVLAASGAHPATIDVAELSGLQAQVSAGQDFNEHVWYSFPTIKKLTDTLAVDLARADPTHAGLFTTNASAFDTRLDTLTAKLTTIKARHGGARVAITEPVPLYLVQAAGLVNATAPEFSKAIEDGTDPSASVLSATLATLTGPDKVAALLENAQTESATTHQVEQAAMAGGVPIVKVTETLPDGITDYLTWMGTQIDALATALQQSPARPATPG
jgi:zinc/manganese transport system substrate-binding protein